MGWVCPEHGKERIHLMILNRDVHPWEFEAIFFSCGRLVAGTIEGKHYHEPDEFVKAFKQLLEKWRQEKELYHHFGMSDLEAMIDRKLGIENV